MMHFHDLKVKSDKTVKDAVLSALEELRRSGPSSTPRDRFEYAEVVRKVVSHECGSDDSTRATDDVVCWTDSKVLSAIWALVCDGCITPQLGKSLHNHAPDVVIKHIVLTDLGIRVLTKDTDHPFRPGFLNRLRGRAPNISDEVVARFEDAITCLEKSVPRAAVVMIGLASEETLRVTHGALLHLKLLLPQKGRMNTRDQLGEVKLGIEEWSNKDECHRLKMAVLAAELIRDARNEASHPGEVSFDRAHVEDLLVQASHGLPAFWEIVIKAGIDKGYSPE